MASSAWQPIETPPWLRACVESVDGLVVSDARIEKPPETAARGASCGNGSLLVPEPTTDMACVDAAYDDQAPAAVARKLERWLAHALDVGRRHRGVERVSPVWALRARTFHATTERRGRHQRIAVMFRYWLY